MKGVLLCGGSGTRLRPMTRITNKHLLTVYNRAMVELPLKTLKDSGVDEVLLISGGEHIGAFVDYLGDGSEFGVELSYRVQSKPAGIADAIRLAEGWVEGVFPVILGDNYFAKPFELSSEATIYIVQHQQPERFGVFDADKNKIIEKPPEHIGWDVVVGFYQYDQRVFDVIKTLKPSDRGELEVTDINNWYLERDAQVVEYDAYWSDMGTPDSLYEVTTFLRMENV